MSNHHGSAVLLPSLLVLAACTRAPAPVPAAWDDPGEEGVRARAAYILRQQARSDPDELLAWFDKAAYFQRGGGDPHKYALPVVLARLHADPADPAAWRLYRHLMAVDLQKGDRGLYHFSVYQRTRLFFQFRDRLPADVIAATEYDVRNFFRIMLGNPREPRHGTENHTWMHRASGYLWAEHLGGADPASGFHDEHRFLRDWLVEETRRLYRFGQGEYDSSTYVGYSLASLSNIVDFSTDPAMREVARAAMDWMLAALARKYFHGCQLGPESRGFARTAVGHEEGKAPRRAGSGTLARQATGSSSDWVCWLYFGDSARPLDLDRDDGEVDRFPVNVLALSGYRPDPVITALARKAVALPYADRGSKPPYVNTTANRSQEQLYVAPGFALGTLYTPDDGVRTSGTILPQTTMFKLLARGTDDVLAFGMGNGYHGHFPLEGRSPYDQYHQAGAAAIDVCWVGADEDARTRHRSLFGWPRSAGSPMERDGWFLWETAGAFVAARPLNGVAAPGVPTTIDGKTGQMVPVADAGYDYLISPGRLGGWVVQAAGRDDFADRHAFAAALTEGRRLDVSRFDPEHREVSFTTLAGEELRVAHSGQVGKRPIASTGGIAVDYDTFLVYDSPYLRQLPGAGILDLTDGVKGLRIDVNPEVPVRTRY